MAKRLRQEMRLIADRAQRSLYLTMYLMNDASQRVRVTETEEVDLSEIKRHLDEGESVFITRKIASVKGTGDKQRGTLRRTIKTIVKAFPHDLPRSSQPSMRGV